MHTRKGMQKGGPAPVTQPGSIDISVKRKRDLAGACSRLLLLVGWLAASIGLYGPWIDHPTAALTLSGVDMGEFVKFLPDLIVIRRLFYLPPFAIVVSVALLIGSRRLGYPRLLQVLGLILAVLVSLQLLPPAWSPSSLLTAEFRVQTIALGICWLLLAGFWLLGRLRAWVAGSLSAVLSLAALVLPTWQLWAAMPAINRVYGTAPMVGWGFPLCMIGLSIVVLGSVLIVFGTGARRTTS